jgi:hypothetical protein
MPFLPGLDLARLCLARSRRSFLAGGLVVALGVPLFGKWFLFVLCGVFGGSVMIDVLRTLVGLVRSFSIFFTLRFSPGLQVGLPRR